MPSNTSSSLAPPSSFPSPADWSAAAEGRQTDALQNVSSIFNAHLEQNDKTIPFLSLSLPGVGRVHLANFPGQRAP